MPVSGFSAVAGQLRAPKLPGQISFALPFSGRRAGFTTFSPVTGSIDVNTFCTPRSVENTNAPVAASTASNVAVLPPVTTTFLGRPSTFNVTTDCSNTQSRSQT